jgi:soluble lytic murein transglycosylase-like protein
MPFTQIRIRIPDIDQPYSYSQGGKTVTYSQPAVKKANYEMLQAIMANYGTAIQRFGTALQIDPGIICSFIATESNGRMVGKNAYGAVGLMQITAATVHGAVTKWSSEVKGAPIPGEVKAVLQSKIPALLTAKPNDPLSATMKAKLEQLLAADGAFNIMAGCLYLRWLIERFGGNFNRAMVAYNAGAYTKSQMEPGTATTPIRTPVDTTALVASTAVPAESRAYLKKMMGVDGYIQIYYKGMA